LYKEIKIPSHKSSGVNIKLSITQENAAFFWGEVCE
jgi:hypothetical protein